MSKEIRDEMPAKLQAIIDEHLKTHTIEEFRALMAEASTIDLSR